MKYFKYLIFIFILFLTPNVFAVSINTDSYSQANNFNYSSRYDYSTDNYLGDQTNFGVGVLGERFNGKSYYFQFNFHHSITALKNYDIKFTSDTYDFTNQINSDRVVPLCYSSFASNFNTKVCDNISIISVKRGSTSGGNSKEFTIRFVPSQNYTYWGFKLAGGLYNLTSVNNFKISNVYLEEVDTSGSNDIINNANQNTQEIINNSTSNTNNIIDNNNQNTQDIINNQNENYQNLIESNNVCKSISKNNIKTDGYLQTNGVIENNDWARSNFGITDYLITRNSSFRAINILNNNASAFCFYDNDYNLISCSANSSMFENGLINVPSNAFYVRFSIYKSDDIPRITYCSNGNQAISDSINETNDYLKDNSDPYIADNDFLSMFNSIGFNDPLQHLLQLPIQFINVLVSQSNTCQTVNLGTLWGVSLSLPCINLQSIIGSGVWSTIDVLMSIGLLVVIIKNLYETFLNLLTMGGEKEAREKFDMPTPMEFLSMILGGDR